MVAARTWRHVRTLLESVLEHSEHVELRLISVSSPGSPRIEKILYSGNADRVSEGSYNLPFRALPLELRTQIRDYCIQDADKVAEIITRAGFDRIISPAKCPRYLPMRYAFRDTGLLIIGITPKDIPGLIWANTQNSPGRFWDDKGQNVFTLLGVAFLGPGELDKIAGG
jgi:hypothetical protein